VWAADNDCFQGLNAPAYLAMLAAIDGLPGCRFVTVPDVVGDNDATLALWERVARLGSRAQPPAFVLQDGVTADAVPWSDCGAVFIGGTTDFKLAASPRDRSRGEAARQVVAHGASQ
jgi:hypothetical protein